MGLTIHWRTFPYTQSTVEKPCQGTVLKSLPSHYESHNSPCQSLLLEAIFRSTSGGAHIGMDLLIIYKDQLGLNGRNLDRFTAARNRPCQSALVFFMMPLKINKPVV